MPSPSREPLTARNADPHALYQDSVQDPVEDVRTVREIAAEMSGRSPKSVREDFCGTAIFSTEWVRGDVSASAVGVDLDASVVDWGKSRHISELGQGDGELDLVIGDVLQPDGRRFDVVCAMNFSYFIFKQRREMLAYFQSVRESLVEDGSLVLDFYGCTEAGEEMEEEREQEGFKFVWDQAEVNAIDNSIVNHIHFRFPDGSSIQEAFTYNWRLWQIPEIVDILHDAGFSDIGVFWEGEDEDGDGTGEFTRETVGDNDPGWIAYIGARR